MLGRCILTAIIITFLHRISHILLDYKQFSEITILHSVRKNIRLKVKHDTGHELI